MEFLSSLFPVSHPTSICPILTLSLTLTLSNFLTNTSLILLHSCLNSHSQGSFLTLHSKTSLILIILVSVPLTSLSCLSFTHLFLILLTWLSVLLSEISILFFFFRHSESPLIQNNTPTQTWISQVTRILRLPRVPTSAKKTLKIFAWVFLCFKSWSPKASQDRENLRGVQWIAFEPFQHFRPTFKYLSREENTSGKELGLR